MNHTLFETCLCERGDTHEIEFKGEKGATFLRLFFSPPSFFGKNVGKVVRACFLFYRYFCVLDDGFFFVWFEWLLVVEIIKLIVDHFFVSHQKKLLFRVIFTKIYYVFFFISHLEDNHLQRIVRLLFLVYYYDVLFLWVYSGITHFCESILMIPGCVREQAVIAFFCINVATRNSQGISLECEKFVLYTFFWLKKVFFCINVYFFIVFMSCLTFFLSV